MRREGVQENTRAINNKNGNKPIIDHVVGGEDAHVHDTWRKSVQQSMLPLLLNNGDIMKSNIQSLDRVNESVVGLRNILGWSY
jgi:hypothetical protein